MQAQEILFALLRAEICGDTVSDEVISSLDAQKLEAVYSFAVRYDLAHIAGRALEKLPLTGCEDILSNFKKQTLQAIYRYVKLDHDYQQICAAFEQAQIPYIPLKGAVLRVYYPEPWMRTSCDTDILIRKEDMDSASKLLAERLGFRFHRRSSHDVAFYSPNGMHFELHHSLIENQHAEKQMQVLQRVWQQAVPVEGFEQQRQMPDELFYFYHIAHMASHVVAGGCGIRPLLDLWILHHKIPGDRQKRETLLEEGALLAFARAAEKLSEVWFFGAQADALSQDLEKFLFAGGVYGSWESNLAIKRRKKDSSLKYFLTRVFVGYKVLRGYYPILERHRWLQPFCWLHWWLKRVFGGGGQRLMQEMKKGTSRSGEEEQYINGLLDNLGL